MPTQPDRCGCQKYVRPAPDVETLTTSDTSIHCFDGLQCLDIRHLVDQCAYSPVRDSEMAGP